MSVTAIDIQNVRKNFKEKQVLQEVNIKVQKGSIYALLGPNGAGKSTLLKIMTGLLPSDGGKVKMNGYDVSKNPTTVQKLFSFSLQNSTVDHVLTGFENLVLIAKLRHIPQPKQVANQLLELFNLSDARDKVVSTYSGGMERRLDLAMSLVGSPEIIFLDEPTTGLDPTSRQELWQKIKEMKSQGKTIFLTTQYLEEADYLADQIGFLQGGRIVATGSPDEMKRMAGENKLLIAFHNDRDTTKALELLRVHQPISNDNNELSIELSDDLTTTMNVLNELTTAKIHIQSFKMITPSLDDVFFTLTKGKDV